MSACIYDIRAIDYKHKPERNKPNTKANVRQARTKDPVKPVGRTSPFRDGTDDDSAITKQYDPPSMRRGVISQTLGKGLYDSQFLQIDVSWGPEAIG